jgi:hypothetical protein
MRLLTVRTVRPSPIHHSRLVCKATVMSFSTTISGPRSRCEPATTLHIMVFRLRLANQAHTHRNPSRQRPIPGSGTHWSFCWSCILALLNPTNFPNLCNNRLYRSGNTDFRYQTSRGRLSNCRHRSLKALSGRLGIILGVAVDVFHLINIDTNFFSAIDALFNLPSHHAVPYIACKVNTTAARQDHITSSLE